MDWNEDVIGRLRAFWAEGLSTAEIGRRLDISKNAVVGKAHRLSLPARPSPIRRGPPDQATRAVPPRRVVGPTLPPLPGPPMPGLAAQPQFAAVPPAAACAPRDVRERAPVFASVDERPLPTVTQAPPHPQPARPAVTMPEAPGVTAGRATPALRPVAAPRGSRRVSACCWPIGEPGKPSFRFCDGEALTGKPYCSEHAQLAYVKIRDRREEAA